MPMTPQSSSSRLFRQFCDRTLPKVRWTHEAHLTVCWHALAEHGAGALDWLRVAIPAYNDATQTPNTSASGYHETLTVYYVEAVAHAGATRPEQLWAQPWCSREAPLRHWSRTTLFDPAARAGWVEPDLAPLPWAAETARGG